MNMFNHYCKIAIRNLARHKVISFINVAGLSLGMTCCLFILLWVKDERGIDNFHVSGDQLFNVYETVNTNNVVTGSYATTIRYEETGISIPIADVQQAVPEVEQISFYATGYELPWGYAETFQVGDKLHKLKGSRAGKHFFEMFSYPLIAGDKATALKDINSIAISRKMAMMFFESPEDAIGRSIRYEDRIDFIVTAVFEDISSNSSLQFDFLFNWDAQMQYDVNWSSPNVLTTLKLAKGADISEVTAKINRFVQSRLDQNDPRKITLGLQPFRDQYLVARFVNGKPEDGRILYVRIFSGVAVFILIIACINFMNLATARAVKRAKEIGVRKVSGSTRAALIRQFLGESIILSSLAAILSVGLLYISLPSFNLLTGKHILLPFKDTFSWLIVLGLMLFTGLVAGSYPALFLSSLKPVRILKGVPRFSNASIWFRKSLAGFQFVISITLIIVTIVIVRQTSYVQKTNLGYDKENLIYLPLEGELKDFQDRKKNYTSYNLFKNRLLQMPGIAGVDRSSEAPHIMRFIVDENDGHTETDSGDDAIQWEGKEKGNSIGFKPLSVGFDFLKVMNLEVVQGRGFSKEVATDSADAFLVNEEAVRQMGMKDPVGKWMSAWRKKGHIIGILKDYHTSSLHEQMKPLVMDVKEYENFGVILVRTEPGETQEAIASLEEIYKEMNPNYPLSYEFIDQDYANLYRSEQVISKLTNVFAVLAILISCLGLLGLVMFSAEQRIKEFGIRKVLGATVTNIITLLSEDFVKLIFISFMIAAPLAGYLMYEWLNGFAFKIALSWWIFAVAGGIALLIAFLIICVQALQSAVANPVRALRTE